MTSILTDAEKKMNFQVSKGAGLKQQYTYTCLQDVWDRQTECVEKKKRKEKKCPTVSPIGLLAI